MATVVPSVSDSSFCKDAISACGTGPGRLLLAADRHAAGGELRGAVFDLAHRPAFVGGLGGQLAGQLRRQGEQRAGVAHLQPTRLEQRADRRRQLQQAQQVGDLGT